MNRSVALHNLGCKVNAYETEAMQQQLVKAGYRIVPFEEKADVYVINTCSVTNMADKKSRQMIHKARKTNPDAVIVAAGCYVQAAGEKVLDDLTVDVIIGNNKKKDLVQILDGWFTDRKRASYLVDIGKTKEYEELKLVKTAEHTRAYIKVQDGCNQFCTYCIIPYTRGRVRSRSMEDVCREVKGLAEKGYREFVLTGIHLSSYGVDISENKKTLLLELIRLLDGLEGVERIRLGSLEPGIITEEFAAALAELKTICPHFHLSLQSGCNATLKRMNRRYTAEEFSEKCKILRTAFENPALTTDVIVGFPQETEEDFLECKYFLEQINFYETHIFKYSRRQGTKAAVMEGQIPEQVKTERSHALLALNAEKREAYIEAFCGKELEVLFEERIEAGGRIWWSGYSREYIRVILDTDEDIGGCIRKVTGKRVCFEEKLLLVTA